MRSVLAALLVCATLLLLAPCAGAATAPSLDGRIFVVDLTMPDGKSEQDTIAFNAGQGDSIACHAYGFGRGAATCTAAGDAVTFAFTTKSEKEGTMDWRGTVAGTAIEGKAVWTKNGTKQDLAFKGEERKQ